MRIFSATPWLRALLALNAAVAAATAVVLVDTVVIVRDRIGLGEDAVAAALACYGAGSMAAALGAPRLLEERGDRGTALPAGFLLAGGLAGAAAALAAAPRRRCGRRCWGAGRCWARGPRWC
ncbi:hypothetical protein ACFQXA_07230 [Nocardiopsis composta]